MTECWNRSGRGQKYRFIQGAVSPPEVIYNPDQSACRLAWDYFHSLNSPLSSTPESDLSVAAVIEYVQDRDLYRMSLPYIEEVICGLLRMY
jgi:hypothetical protein